MLPPLPRELRAEILDLPDPDPEELRVNLEDLARIHRLGGGRGAESGLTARLASWPHDRPVRILDVGSGGGDLLVSLLGRCRRHGLKARLVGVDRSRMVLRIARIGVAAHPEISLVTANALALPFPPRSFDFVVCSLLLHHISPDRSEDFLRALRTLAREQVVVSDLRRGRWEYWLTWMFTRLLARGRMTRHDGPLSVLRSLTLAEARELARRAGWNPAQVRRIFPMRILMLARKDR